METTAHNPARKTSLKVLIVSVVLLLADVLYPLTINRLPLVMPWTAERARQRAPLVRVGMTESQVWSTLGLAKRGLRAHVEGSGPSNYYPANYVLWPRNALHMRWNLTSHPTTLVEFKFQNQL